MELLMSLTLCRRPSLSTVRSVYCRINKLCDFMLIEHALHCIQTSVSILPTAPVYDDYNLRDLVRNGQNGVICKTIVNIDIIENII